MSLYSDLIEFGIDESFADMVTECHCGQACCGIVSFKGDEGALLDYWGKNLGVGNHDFDKCVAKLQDKKGIDDAKALCAWLHKKVSGVWQGQEGK